MTGTAPGTADGGNDPLAAPVFIVGVPRSGTTLLRMMLDSHPGILCGPEAPWIGGRGIKTPPNLGDLVDFLTRDPAGVLRTFHGVSESLVFEAARSFIRQVMGAAIGASGKSHWADKTPEHMLAVPFLVRLFPSARFVHLVRDGRDVALSTTGTRWEGIVLGTSLVPNTYRNALTRWVQWIGRFESDAASVGAAVHQLRYEDLVREPGEEMAGLLSFLDIPWDDRVLTPYSVPHAGAASPRAEGEKSFHARTAIDPESVGRWRKQLGFRQRRVTRELAEPTLRRLGYEATTGGGLRPR